MVPAVERVGGVPCRLFLLGRGGCQVTPGLPARPETLMLEGIGACTRCLLSLCASMKTFVLLVGGLTVALGWFGAERVHAAGESKRKIAFIAGLPSHGYAQHEYNAGCLLLGKCLSRGMSGVECVFYNGGWPKDPQALDRASAIVIFSDGLAGHPILRHLDQLDKLMRRGAGLVCLHDAVVVPKGKPGDRLKYWLGGCYETSWPANPGLDRRVQELARSPDHPRRQTIRDSRRVVLSPAVCRQDGGRHADLDSHATRRREKDATASTAAIRPSERKRARRRLSAWARSGPTAAAASASPGAIVTGTGPTTATAPWCSMALPGRQSLTSRPAACLRKHRPSKSSKPTRTSPARRSSTATRSGG